MPTPKLPDQVISVARLRHLGLTTERADEDGYGIRTVQESPGHKDVRTTMIYTHVLNRERRGVKSPRDA